MRIEELDTPIVIIDLDRMERNIQKMQAYCDQNGIRLRPHIKTHKIPAIAHKQLAAGAKGITCQKLGEAEVFARAGINDILITYPILGLLKLDRVAMLARQVRLTICADSATGVEFLAAAGKKAGVPIGVLVEFDHGNDRTGVRTPAEALKLARQVLSSPDLEFRGLMSYPCKPQLGEYLSEARALFRDAGIDIAEISVGGTSGPLHAHELDITELRAGAYVFYDLLNIKAGMCTLDEIAMRVRTTVVSQPTSDLAIIDAGTKTISSDQYGLSGYGHIVEYPEALIEWLTEEHGMVNFSRCSRRPEVGEVVTLLPNHTCIVTNLHDELVGVRGDEVEVIWPVDARGLVR
jgi:D-serine deaminase-like pyridoxal phosphate-dependent protein